MTPGTLNLTLTQGDGYSNVLTLQDALGNALDQSAYTWRPGDSGWSTEINLGDTPATLVRAIERLRYGLEAARAEGEE